MIPSFSLSANIEEGKFQESHYVVTPNGLKAAQCIIDDFNTGIHSFTIIGTFGTGKSSFLLAFEADLYEGNEHKRIINPKNLSSASKYEILNIVGDYTELSTLLRRKLNIEGSSKNILDELKAHYNKIASQDKFLIIVIDEFGKVLEHAAKNHPERELYFLQKFAEFVNAPKRKIILLTTLHQNFGAYAKDLSETQKNEWSKVKGRFKEITFVEPIEQLLFLASKQWFGEKRISNNPTALQLYNLARATNFVENTFSEQTACQLFPLDTFSAYALTAAIQRYGQNERSLFSFLAANGSNSLSKFDPKEHSTYNLALVYDYIIYSFYTYLRDANADAMSWSAINVSIERAEGMAWDNPNQMIGAIKIIKAIGLLNLLGKAGFHLNEQQICEYAENAMDVPDARPILQKLIRHQIVRFAEYKNRMLLFEGTDIDLDAEILKAGAVVARPVSFVDDLRYYINHRIAPVKAHYYQNGTPRFFEYEVREEPVEIVPRGDTDGYIELIFSQQDNAVDNILEFSQEHNGIPIIFVLFNNTEDIVSHLYNIQKYRYILDKVLLDKQGDRVAFSEIQKLMEYEDTLLNKSINDQLFAYNGRAHWIFAGEEQTVSNFKDFNKLLSLVCDTIYPKTPVMNNELFNKQKLSSAISLAKKNYLTALVEHHQEDELGFEPDKFPPEKTIYYSLLKNTGLHSDGQLRNAPSKTSIMPLWDACEQFLASTVSKTKRISELIKILSQKPYKLKQGFIDFWIPTYLFLKRQDYALHDVTQGAYIPNVDLAFFELLQKHPSNYSIKAFAMDGVNIDFFNQYRKFVNLGDELAISRDTFVETIKPFLFFYKRLNDYTKNTRKFDHPSTMRFRDVLASAKDPEKAFFEDLPEALGFDRNSLVNEQSFDNYGILIQRAIRELRNCYNQLIDRIESRIVDELDLQSSEYDEYILEIRSRLKPVKTHLLTDKQKEFCQHVMTEYDNRTLWYQSVCYVLLEHKLESLKDEEEDKLSENLVYMFRECERYADISKLTSTNDRLDAYSFDMVTTTGTNFHKQTFVLPEKDKHRSEKLEKQIDRLLTGDNNLDVCTLLSVLNKKLKK